MSDQNHPYGNPPPMGDARYAGAMGVASAPVQDPSMLNYRGASLQQSFRLRERIKISREKPMNGLWIAAFPHMNMARVCGQAGYDFVILDWEHTPMAIDQVVELIKAVQYAGEGKTAVVVRVPSFDHVQIGWVLDAGASGIILPHCESVEQVKAAVSSARFPMYGGTRSGPPAALMFGFNDAADGPGAAMEIWDRAAVIVQVESKLGADMAAEMAAVPGVDALMVGPGDLAFDMKIDYLVAHSDPRWQAAVGSIVKAAKDNDRGCMLMAPAPAMIPMSLDMGATMLVTAMDAFMFVKAITNNLSDSHGAIEEWKGKQQKE